MGVQHGRKEKSRDRVLTNAEINCSGKPAPIEASMGPTPWQNAAVDRPAALARFVTITRPAKITGGFNGTLTAYPHQERSRAHAIVALLSRPRATFWAVERVKGQAGICVQP